jgi:ATP-dependent RNA helicase UAP56/SUB2
MGKTAVFVIAILHQLQLGKNGQYEPHQAIITCHSRELAHQISKDFKRLGRYCKNPEVRYGCYYGGQPI